MKELDEIRARLEAAKSHAAPAFMIPTMDVARLLATVEAVEALAESAPRFTTHGGGSSSGIVSADAIRAAITAALTPTPAVLSGAGEPRGAGVAPVDVGEILGPETGAWQFRGGDLVEWVSEGGTWKVIPSNIYDDKYASIQQRNRIVTSVPYEELRHIGRKP